MPRQAGIWIYAKLKERKPPDYSIERVTDSFEGTIQSKLGIKTAGYTIELFYPLLKAKNCIITPHISWDPRERLMNIAEDNLNAFIYGKPVNVVNTLP